MTRTELTTRAQDRALVENVRVHPIVNNSALFAATSITTTPGGFWLVSVDVAGSTSCSCPAGQNGRPCKHAAAVEMHLHEARMVIRANARHQEDMAALAAIFEA